MEEKKRSTTSGAECLDGIFEAWRSCDTAYLQLVRQWGISLNTVWALEYLVKHPDGFTWLHTGDMGYMDDEGFIYFKQRIKRMIVTSGYNVYPSQLENIIDGIDEVQMSCVIGVPDPYKIQKVKAFVQLKQDIAPSEEIKQKILSYCKERIAKYAMPYDIEFREQLPKTLVGKIAYTVLEKEEEEKLKAQKN